MAPGRGGGDRTQGLRVTLGRSRRASLTTPPRHTPPARASCDFVHHSPPTSPSPSSARGHGGPPPGGAPPRGIRRREPVFSEVPAPRPHRLRAPRCAVWDGSSSVPRKTGVTGAATAPTGGLFNASFHGFPSNWLIHSFLDWGGFVSTLKLQRKSLGKRFSSGVPGGSSSQTPAPGPGGASALLVFLLQARPGLNTGLRARL